MTKKRFARAIVHIGTEKTGTTSLQKFLSGNRPALEDAGFLYPKTFGEQNHYRFCVLAQAPDKLNDIRKLAFHYSRSDSLSDFTEKMLQGFEDESEKSNANTLLISNEHLHSHLVTKDEKQRLLQLLTPYCDKIEIVVYLRRQDEVAVSRFSTRIKTGNSNFTKVFGSSTDTEYYYDYWKMLSEYAEVFGKENIICRLFNRKELHNGDIVADFMNLVGVQDLSKFETFSRENESISENALFLLARFNAVTPRFIGGKPNPLRGDIVDYLTENFPGKPYQPNFGEVSEFLSLYNDSNQKVLASFFPDRKSLFEMPDEAKYQGQGGLNVDVVAEVAVELLNHEKQKTIVLQRASNIQHLKILVHEKQLQEFKDTFRAHIKTLDKTLNDDEIRKLYWYALEHNAPRMAVVVGNFLESEGKNDSEFLLSLIGLENEIGRPRLALSLATRWRSRLETDLRYYQAVCEACRLTNDMEMAQHYLNEGLKRFPEADALLTLKSEISA